MSEPYDAITAILNAPLETEGEYAVRQAKERATLVARCRLLRPPVALCFTEDDRGQPLFVVSRDALTKAMHSPEEVNAWIKFAGGPNA